MYRPHHLRNRDVFDGAAGHGDRYASADLERIVQVQRDQRVPGLPAGRKKEPVPAPAVLLPGLDKDKDKNKDKGLVYETGVPAQSTVYQYLLFIATERALEASKSKIVDTFEARHDEWVWCERQRQREEEAAQREPADAKL